MAANPVTETSLDLSWLDLYDSPSHAEPGKKGLTLKGINLGKFRDGRARRRRYDHANAWSNRAPRSATLRPELCVEG